MSPGQTALVAIGQLVDNGEATIQTGPFGTQLKANEYVASGWPVINVRNIGYGSTRDADLEYVSDAKAHDLHAHRLQSGDIVFGRKGAVDRHALVKPQQVGWVQGSDCIRLRISSSRVHIGFLSHYFKTSSHRHWMEAQGSFGATMSSLNQGIIRRIAFPAIPFDEQQKIAAILTAYDDLIENNRQRIALLEQMAEEIYREWFVRLRFPGHEHTPVHKGVPDGWGLLTGADLFDIAKGRSYASKDISNAPTGEDEERPFLTLKSLNRGGGYRREGLKFYRGQYSDSQIVSTGDVIVAVTDMTQSRAVVGQAARVPDLSECDKAVISLDLVCLRPKRWNKTFLYAYCRYSGVASHLAQFANGANVLHLKPDVISSQHLISPPSHLIEQFTPLVEPLFNLIDSLTEETIKLEETRDLLLNRLISGKLRVDDLDIQFPPSMREPAT